VGQSVFALLGYDRGAYAQHIIVRKGEWAAKPENVSYVEAAAVPLAALTAWQGMIDQGGLREGQRVLIHGGAGDIGHFAVQIAKVGRISRSTIKRKSSRIGFLISTLSMT
jgi:NADPH:quinone reductase-like Zn-dependent oxidoreductase